MDSVVLDKEIFLYRERCLHDIDAKDILIIRCLALGSSNYENRTTWLIDTLTKDTTMSMHECLKCVTRIQGKRVCNAYFALAIGYSRSRLTSMITEI